jgi:hypothetical protein
MALRLGVHTASVTPGPCLDGARAIELSESSWRSLQDPYGLFHPSKHALFSATHPF